MIELPLAHGGISRADLPLPEWLFAWAAGLVLVVSFVALAALWPEPKLQDEGWRPLPRGVSRVLTSRPLEIACGAAGVALLVVVVYSGLAGVQSFSANFAWTFVYITFWVGLVALSVLLGDVFRAFNPWRAIGRGFAFVARIPAGGELPRPLPYPERVWHWPAAAGIFSFALLELVATGGDRPENIAIAALVYTAVTFVAMALYGVEAWCERGEAFSVYFNLFSRLSVFERRGDEIGLRRPMSGLPALAVGPGTVPLLAVMIGSVTFDGASEASLWNSIAPDLAGFFQDVGLAPPRALEAAFAVGLLAGVLLVYLLYRLGVAGARTVGGGFSTDQLARAFVHSLVPIAFAYVAAHYLTFLLLEGQGIVFLASDPLGHDADLFGTADYAIDYGLIGATATWYWQVGFVIAGHVAALTLAHDRALAMYDRAQAATRSQYWMLAVMVGFTSLALWLLSQSNA